MRTQLVGSIVGLLIVVGCDGDEETDGSGGASAGTTAGTASGTAGSGGSGTAGSGGTAGSHAGGAGGAGGANPCSGCDSAEGCIQVHITRAADDSTQPWVVWPTEADGLGTLIVSALQGSDTVARETIADADMTPSNASYDAYLCVPPGTAEVRVFLDDDGDVQPDATYSADYLDSCMGDNSGCFRCIEATVAAGLGVGVTAELVGSCD